MTSSQEMEHVYSYNLRAHTSVANEKYITHHKSMTTLAYHNHWA